MSEVSAGDLYTCVHVLHVCAICFVWALAMVQAAFVAAAPKLHMQADAFAALFDKLVPTMAGKQCLW